MATPTQTIMAGDLHVKVSATPDRPLILLLRMAGRDMGIWDTIWEDFARHFTVANFDLMQSPGMQRLDDPAEMFRRLAASTAQVADALGFEQFHVFGWNGGTLVALRCAMDYPERMQSCILLDPFYQLDDMRHVDKALEFKRTLFENPNRELYAYYWVMAGLSDAFIAEHFDVVERLVAQRLAGDRFVRVDSERFMRWVRALRTNWFEDADYARITAPTLILATELDRWNAGPSVAMARAVQQRIQRSELVVIDKVGGLFLIEDPKRFMGLVEPFVRKVV